MTKLASVDRRPGDQAQDGRQGQTIRACVAADGTPDPAMFVEAGDTCTDLNTYLRSGRMSVQYNCTRAGKGELYPNVDGNYTADGYKALVTSRRPFPGDGDYTLTRMLTAKRVGDCPRRGRRQELNFPSPARKTANHVQVRSSFPLARRRRLAAGPVPGARRSGGQGSDQGRL